MYARKILLVKLVDASSSIEIEYRGGLFHSSIWITVAGSTT